MAVYRAKKKKQEAGPALPQEEAEKKKEVLPTDPVSDDAMERLARLMNNTPTITSLKGTEWEIRGMKPGIQWLIAEEVCKVVRGENLSMGDVIKEFATNLPSVCRVLTLALVNDKCVLDKGCEQYHEVYDTLMWGDYQLRDWVTLLFEVISLIDVDFFFESTDAIATVRQMTLTRKTTRKEQSSLPAEPSGGR